MATQTEGEFTGPWMLPMVCYQMKRYFVDLRLGQFREIENPANYFDFDGEQGRQMRRQSGVVTCPACFLPGEWFGDVRCRHGHPTRLFNIGRDHFVACDNCRIVTFVGSNLMSGWRQENEDLWWKNSKSVEGYEFFE